MCPQGVVTHVLVASGQNGKDFNSPPLLPTSFNLVNEMVRLTLVDKNAIKYFAAPG